MDGLVSLFILQVNRIFIFLPFRSFGLFILFSFFFFKSTQWVSDIYFATHPDMDDKESWAKGTRAGSFALLCYSVISVIAGVVFPILSANYKKFKLLSILNIYTLSHLTVAAVLISSWFVTNVTGATVVLAVMGIPWAIVMWIPFSLVGEYVSYEDEQRQIMNQGQGSTSDSVIENESSILEEEFDAGMILGVHNMYVVFPQFAIAIISSFLFAAAEAVKDKHQLSTVTPVLIFGGFMALIAAAFSRNILRVVN
jgi:solute carrier family 45 protein 1/2/4